MGSKERVVLPEELCFECSTCNFKTQKQQEFKEHALLHYNVLPLECRMKCHLCDVEEKSAPLFWNHLEKKRHKARVFYTENAAYFRDDDGRRAMYLTVEKFGEKTARKVDVDRLLDKGKTVERV